MDAPNITPKTALAVGFLAVAGYVFYSMVLANDEAPATALDSVAVVDPAEEEAGNEAVDPAMGRSEGGDSSAGGRPGSGVASHVSKARKARPIRLDLLPVYGVYESGTTVSNPFRGPISVNAAMVRGARRGGSDGSVWRPPELRVSMIMQAGSLRRATVDGAVYGTGDPIAGGGKVRRIERDGIEISLDGTLLFYDLQDPYPRGYEPPPPASEEGDPQSRSTGIGSAFSHPTFDSAELPAGLLGNEQQHVAPPGPVGKED